MKPNPAFVGLPGTFWAHVKLVSERLGYASKKSKSAADARLRRFTVEEIRDCLAGIGLRSDQVFDLASGNATELGVKLCDYLNYRAESLEEFAEPNLMDREQARIEFERLRASLDPSCDLPMNKQKGDKRHHSYLVGMVNMLTEHALGGRAFVSNPRRLTLTTRDNIPLRTGSRWMDGAYPDVIDPTAVWEIKEHYGTTTFGSRVSAAVYESMLDGYELGDLYEAEGRKVHHYLIVDDRFTWWIKGRPYLCRIADTMHAGLLDEAIFGCEVLTRWPEIVASWP